MKNLLILTALFCAATYGSLQAQTASDLDMQVFARNFMNAYNQQDAAAMQKMYLADAVRVDAAGKELKGADKIAAFFAEQFKLNNVTVFVRQNSVHWSDFQHAWLARGTYEVNGSTHASNQPVHFTGGYENTMFQVEGQWKIGKSVHSPLVKVVVYHEVKDFAQWKSAFNEGLPALRTAGGLNCEIGTLQGDPNTAYVISEWPSVEIFQSFFSDPRLKGAMGEAGVVGKPAILILDQQ